MIDMRDFANTLLGQMAAAQTGASAIPEDEYRPVEPDLPWLELNDQPEQA
jgi:hypothetical protein